MEKNKWIVLNYNLPTEPSRYRVAAWRGLKKLGALNVQQSMWVLPYNEGNYLALEKISKGIEENMGEALLMKSSILYEEQEDRIIFLFNNIRDEEYKEFIEECEKYLKEIQKEISKEKFIYAELEEEEEELNKLVSWYKKIRARDTFNSSKGKAAIGKLDEIKKSYDNYGQLVFKHNNKSGY